MAQSDNYPREIATFLNLLLSLAGINDVCCSIERLGNIKNQDLSVVDLGHFPIATLLRTGGGLADENLIQFRFSIDKTTMGLDSLEFISWFVRDQARSGQKLQLRTSALPPVVHNQRQLGETLKFYIDYFVIEKGNLQNILDKVNQLSESMRLFIDLYSIELKK